MVTALIYLLVVALVGAALFGLASVVFGRGEELAPLGPRTTLTRLPETGVRGEDVRVLRFAQVVRGYRASEVDWALERLAQEIDALRGEVALLTQPPVEQSTQPPVESSALPAVNPSIRPTVDPSTRPTVEQS